MTSNQQAQVEQLRTHAKTFLTDIKAARFLVNAVPRHREYGMKFGYKVVINTNETSNERSEECDPRSEMNNSPAEWSERK